MFDYPWVTDASGRGLVLISDNEEDEDENEDEDKGESEDEIYKVNFVPLGANVPLYYILTLLASSRKETKESGVL
jgi:hypothetical protein